MNSTTSTEPEVAARTEDKPATKPTVASIGMLAHRLAAMLQALGGHHDHENQPKGSKLEAVKVRATLYDIPGDVRRRVENREIPDPMWYAGRVGPSAYDVARADTAEFVALTDLRDEFEKRHLQATQRFESRRSLLRPRNHVQRDN